MSNSQYFQLTSRIISYLIKKTIDIWLNKWFFRTPFQTLVINHRRPVIGGVLARSIWMETKIYWTAESTEGNSELDWCQIPCYIRFIPTSRYFWRKYAYYGSYISYLQRQKTEFINLFFLTYFYVKKNFFLQFIVTSGR